MIQILRRWICDICLASIVANSYAGAGDPDGWRVIGVVDHTTYTVCPSCVAAFHQWRIDRLRARAVPCVCNANGDVYHSHHSAPPHTCARCSCDHYRPKDEGAIR